MIVNSSPLETLAAFGLAFASGIVCGLCLCKYARHIRSDALSVITPR